MLQVVVPDPSTRVLTRQPSRIGTAALFAPAQAPACNFAYVADHSAPNGAGRTLLLQILAPGVGDPMTVDPLVADVAAGSEVMCARISTYWVDANNVLRRSDFALGGMPFMAGGVTVTPAAAAGADIITLGVEDMQIASAFSSAVPGAAATNRWAHDVTGGLNAAVGATPRNRLEARQIRFNILARSLRRLPRGTQLQQPRLEHSPIVVNLDIAY